jgi:exoribonuclease II
VAVAAAVKIERSEVIAAAAPQQVQTLPAELSEERRKFGHDQRREADWLMRKRCRELCSQRRNFNAEIVTGGWRMSSHNNETPFWMAARVE